MSNKEESAANEVPVLEEEEEKLRSSSSEEVSPPATAEHSVLDDTSTADEGGVRSAAERDEDTRGEERAEGDGPASPSDEIVYPGMVTKVGVGIGLALAIFLVKHLPSLKLETPAQPEALFPALTLACGRYRWTRRLLRRPSQPSPTTSNRSTTSAGMPRHSSSPRAAPALCDSL